MDTQKVMPSDFMIYWGRGNSSHMVQIQWRCLSQGHYSGGFIKAPTSAERGAELGKVRFRFLNAAEVQTSVNWFSNPEQTCYARVFCMMTDSLPVPSITTVLCYAILSPDEHTAICALGYHIVQLFEKYLNSSQISVWACQYGRWLTWSWTAVSCSVLKSQNK